jgi:hypothetical protein
MGQKNQIRSTVGINPELVSQLLSALSSSASKNLAAVSVSHSFTETVFHLSVTLLGLICSLHLSNLRFKTRKFISV